MTFSDNKESLKYRLMGSKEEIGSWGHEYVRYQLVLKYCTNFNCRGQGKIFLKPRAGKQGCVTCVIIHNKPKSRQINSYRCRQ